jgi:hypothetical protein
MAGDPNKTNVADDIKNAEDKGISEDSPAEGPNVVYMDDPKPDTGITSPHAGLLFNDGEGDVTFYDNSSNPGYSRSQKYDSVSDFENDYGYNGFYYVPVN